MNTSGGVAQNVHCRHEKSKTGGQRRNPNSEVGLKPAPNGEDGTIHLGIGGVPFHLSRHFKASCRNSLEVVFRNLAARPRSGTISAEKQSRRQWLLREVRVCAWNTTMEMCWITWLTCGCVAVFNVGHMSPQNSCPLFRHKPHRATS